MFANEVVLTKEEIDEVITNVAKELNDKYKGGETIPVFVGVLKGALPFMMDLMKKLDFDLEMDFIQVSSYSGTSSTGVIHLKKDVTANLRDREVIIVEDIIDTGLTLNYLKQYLQINYNPKSIKIVCLVDKKPLRKVNLIADIAGITINENKFLVGYGFDYNELGRNIDYIFIPCKKQIEHWEKLLKKK